MEVIGIFNTTLKTPDYKKVIVPNGKIINDVITNVTSNPTRRVDVSGMRKPAGFRIYGAVDLCMVVTSQGSARSRAAD